MEVQRPILLDFESSFETSVPVRSAPWKALIGSAVAACGLASIGYAAGQKSLRGLRVSSATSEVLRTTDEFKVGFDKWAEGLTCVKLNHWVNVIVNAGTTTDSLDATEFKEWYKGTDPSLTAEDKVVANGIMTAAIEKSCSPAVATTAPVKTADEQTLSAHSYSEFGHLFSQETAGKTWAEVGLISATVQAVQVPVGTSAVLQRLNGWYHSQLTDLQRKQFAESMVQMQSGINAR